MVGYEWVEYTGQSFSPDLEFQDGKWQPVPEPKTYYVVLEDLSPEDATTIATLYTLEFDREGKPTENHGRVGPRAKSLYSPITPEDIFGASRMNRD